MRRVALSAIVVVLAAGAPAARADAPLELVGALHEHSAYSDGYPGTTPATYYASGRRHHLDFMGGSEHSDNTDLPLTASDECLQASLEAAACIETSPDALRKWDATLEQANAATDASFTAFRGFEWTSDRFGHVNVYFSTNVVGAKNDGGYATMDALYAWAQRPASAGGGSDGLLTFNHPGDKKLSTSDPGFNWNDFAYDPRIDPQMVGLEVFNDRGDFASGVGHEQPPEGWFAHALDKGWHVGAIGAEDNGHKRTDDWGGDPLAKTVVLADRRSRAAIRAAMAARRFYATLGRGPRLSFTVAGAPMGSRVARTPGDAVRVAAQAADADGTPLALDLITNGGQLLATSLDGRLDRPVRFTPPPAGAAASRWLFVRARRGDEVVAYSSPVWIERARGGSWLAGDLHVHSCFSHDVYCGPSDDNTGPDEAYTLGEGIGQRFAEAGSRGLDFLAITDHNDVRSAADPDFGSAGVLGVPGYEDSIHGHAQVLGTAREFGNGDASAAAITHLVSRLHANGAVFQANHPGYRMTAPFNGCGDTGVLHWQYGYDVQPDTIEILNPTSPAGAAEAYLECWLDRGAHIGVTGGSDNHWASLSAAGIGYPTTWVLARSRSVPAILDALRAGHTAVSKLPPSAGGSPLLLEADANRDGTFEAVQGDTVRPGAPMRVRARDATLTGLVRVRANGATLVDGQALAPGGSVTFRAPDQRGWVRAALLATPGDAAAAAPGCEASGQSVSECAYDAQLLALTSPLYLR